MSPTIVRIENLKNFAEFHLKMVSPGFALAVWRSNKYQFDSFWLTLNGIQA